MKINYYFEWCSGADPDEYSMDLDYGHWAMSDLWFKVYRKLKIKYPDIEFKSINNAFIRKDAETYAKFTNGGTYYSANGKFGCSSMIIENPENKKFIVLTMADHIEDLYHDTNNWDMENCAQLITSMGLTTGKHEKFEKTKIPFVPSIGSYLDNLNQEKLIDKIYKEKNSKTFSEKPKFIGHIYGIRVDLKETKKLDIINKNEINLQTAESFLRELDKYKINLSLNSVSEMSGRDYEIFGLGNVNLRCILNTATYYDPLIPNFHYAAINIFDHSDPNLIADAFLEKYEYLKKNPELVEFISKNGREWYEQNVPREKASSTLVDKIIDINKLS